MAVERLKEFTIDLGDLVKTRLDSFVKSRARIHAAEEAAFQRSVIDNDLSYQEQLDYRQAQLEDEKGETYPDIIFMDEIETSITSFKKMVRYKKFRDGYFTFLEEYVAGKKSLDDHLTYLENEMNNSLDKDVREEMQEKIVNIKKLRREQDLKIINTQVQFAMKDKTADSINGAIALLKKQLIKPETQKDELLRTSYEQQLKSLEKGLTEIQIEDRVSGMVIGLVGKDMAHTSLWKIETFASFRDNANIDSPINVGGVRYNSEQEYWETTLNSYIQNDFVDDYIGENQKEATLLSNQIGRIPDTYLEQLASSNSKLKLHKELQLFQQTALMAVQGSIIEAMTLKAQDLTQEYYLNSPEIAITSNYENAMKELEGYKKLFGEDYSLSPAIQNIETKLINYQVGRTEETLTGVSGWKQSYYDEYGEFPTPEETQKYLKTQGVISSMEVTPETYLEGEPHEIAEEVIESGKKIPELYGKKAKLEEKVKKAKEQVEAKKVVKPVAPKQEVKPTLSATEQKLKEMGLLERYQKIKAEKQAPKPAAPAEKKQMYNLTRPDGSESRYHITPSKLQEYLKKPGYSLIK